MVVSAVIGLAILFILVALIVYVIMIYNGLVRLKHNIDKSWSNIDVLLKQRFDELPKLVSVCEGYMKHERDTLEAVIKARSMVTSGANPEAQLDAQNAISQALKSLFAVVEKYPDLKADTSFRQLQARVSEIEDQIADRREFYNESVNLNNIRVEEFPDVLVARFFNFPLRKLWEIEPAHREDVEVRFGTPAP